MFEKVNALTLIERVGMHSHIHGLGVDGKEREKAAQKTSRESARDEVVSEHSGLVGREQERKTLFLLSKLVEQHKGRTVLITGPSGSGKSALEYALMVDLKKKGVPYKSVSASEIVSSPMGKTETLTQCIREALGIQVQETSRVLEGEVVEIHSDRERATSGRVIMKTTEVESAYTFGAAIMQAMHTERVEPGDIIIVNKTAGTVKKKGRSLSQTRDYDAIGPMGQYLPCPEGEILKTRIDAHTVTLHEIDILNSKQSVVRMSTGEIPVEVREAVNNTMKEWVEEGRGSLVTGVLFINESELLDTECYSFLNTLSEVSVSPVVMLSTNKEQYVLRGSKEMSKYGMPADFYSRVLEIRLAKYSAQEIKNIIEVRVKEESDKINKEGVGAVCDLAIEYGLRYAFNILSALDVYSSRTGKDIGAAEVKEIFELFSPHTTQKRDQ